MDTFFAPAGRADDKQFRVEIGQIANNPVIDGLLTATSGLLAVLNEHRQILAVNQTLLNWLGVGAAANMLGLRAGEALACVHAHDMAGGCGTSEHCRTCGMAISIVSSLAQDVPSQRTCALSVERNGALVDMFLRVQCCPMHFGPQRLLLLFLQDITREQQAAAVERVFFHDLVNVVTAMSHISESLVRSPQRNTEERARQLAKLSLRLAREIKIQRCLADPASYAYQQAIEDVPLFLIFDEVRSLFAGHPVANGKHLSLQKRVAQISIKTDLTLLLRVLSNMLVNALEASSPGDEVRMWVDQLESAVSFCVWNRQAIPPDLAKRVFQRNFSTKQDLGRGLGTYSMRLLGEQFLRGRVDFSTSEQDGTVFRLTLPVAPPAAKESWAR